MLLTGLSVALHVGGPQREVVPQQLHDERGVLVALLRQRVQLGDRVVKRGLREPTRAVRTVQDFIIEYLHRESVINLCTECRPVERWQHEIEKLVSILLISIDKYLGMII